jgi:hypothetical protein
MFGRTKGAQRNRFSQLNFIILWTTCISSFLTTNIIWATFRILFENKKVDVPFIFNYIVYRWRNSVFLFLVVHMEVHSQWSLAEYSFSGNYNKKLDMFQSLIYNLRWYPRFTPERFTYVQSKITNYYETDQNY